MLSHLPQAKEEGKEIEETEKSTDSEPSETADETEETEDYGGDEVNYSDKIYRVGEDIPTGGYAEYLYNTTDSIFADLNDGMIMMVKYGEGKYSADKGPVIN